MFIRAWQVTFGKSSYTLITGVWWTDSVHFINLETLEEEVAKFDMGQSLLLPTGDGTKCVVLLESCAIRVCDIK